MKKGVSILMLVGLLFSFTSCCTTGNGEADDNCTPEQKEGLRKLNGIDFASNEVVDPAAVKEANALIEEMSAGKYQYSMTTITEDKKIYKVADIDDVSKVYKENADKNNCFAVISKREYRLYVYETVGKNIVLVAHYPVCYARNTGDKINTGDMCTPECSYEKPFYIKQIQDASTWKHDFHDGRGPIPAFGNYFMRLDLSKSDCHVPENCSIGIHGCGGNEASVPGQDSEGCIRLRDADIKDFRNRFAHVGMKIVVKPFAKDKYDFEKTAEKECKNYCSPKKGYKKH